MFTVASVAELGGQRSLLKSPRGTPLRILTLHLRRYFHRPIRISLPLVTLATARNPGSRYSSIYDGVCTVRHATTRTRSALVADDELELIRDLFNRFGSNITPRTTVKDGNSRYGSSPTSSPDKIRPANATATADPAHQLAPHFSQVIQAMKHQDTRNLLHRISQNVVMDDQALDDFLAALPRTTFTELLRSLDPFRVARECDPTDQVHIPVGMYTMLNMDNTVDEWGVRKVYMRLLPVLVKLMLALKRSGQLLLMEEYTYLLRCAGAASDPDVARMIWGTMNTDKTTHWRQSDAYTEFTAARFMTNPLYSSYDKSRRMVTPRNLHRSRSNFANRKVVRLDRLRFNVRLHRYRFGLNKNLPYAEHLMRKMRHQRAALKVFQRTIKDNYMMTESLLCAHMIALGRSGSLRLLGSKILQDYFGIKMSRLTFDDDRKVEVEEIPMIHRTPSYIRPTVRLMRAVVEVYGSNGEITVAFQLLDHISDVHSIRIPPDVWYDLLQWTYIMGSPPASTAWAAAGWHWKIPSPAAVQMIWDVMTAEPYNVRPGFDQYNILIRSLLARGLTEKALPHMRASVERYHAQCREFERAALEHIQCLRDGVGSAESALRYERARFHKHRKWYDIHIWCRKLLLSSHLARLDAPGPPVSDLIGEFRPFLTNPVRYLTPSGYVSLTDPTLETVRPMGGRSIVSHVPMKYGRTWVKQRINRWRPAVASSYSLYKRLPSILDPMRVLAGKGVRQGSKRVVVKYGPVRSPVRSYDLPRVPI